MPARAVRRSLEEEQVFQQAKRQRNAERQRDRRQRIASLAANNDPNALEYLQANRQRNTERQRNRRQGIALLGSNHRFDVSLSDIQEHFIGEMNIVCKHCGAKHFKAEEVSNKKLSFNDCCSHGEVDLEALPDPPEILKNLFNRSHESSTHFHERIRRYNNAFAFASFNANLVNFPSNNRPGPYCFKIQGQIYYQINTALYPSADDSPSFGQLFIVDQNEATDIRSQINGISTLNREIIDAIGNTLRENNVFAQSYQMMHEELRQVMLDNNEQAELEMQLLFSLKPGMDARRYNAQRVNEVAAIFTTTADGDIPESYVTIHNKNTKELKYVSSMDSNVEPWIYPLFYPFGTRGWHSNIPCVTRSKRVTRAAYVKYRMATRDNIIFLMGGRLFQQWLVDSYVKIERDRAYFCRTNQKKIRADSYQGLIDHLQQRANETNTRVGKMVILPSSFTGSPRNMLQHYQDAMAIVRRFGKPDLFITMTCNPKWREIDENLLPGQTASDRPDLVSRIFEIKKNKLIKKIEKEKLFGDVLAYAYVVEYQKRGLPHVHILITLKQNSKITTPNIVDKYISAEIPNPEKELILHSIVMKNMIHGPCGDWCKDDKGNCSKKFPKTFQEETTMDENGYPTYRRRNTGIYQCPSGSTADNQYVVPYNPTLLLLFNCHINVEVVSNIKAVKYLYKYVYKGHDAACIVLTDSTDKPIDHDEIKNHIESRYVSPVEACDRIFGRPLQQKSHSITRLSVHLPDQQTTTLDDEAAEDSIRAAMDKQTMLMDYFALNQRDSMARMFTYAEIPEHFVFKKKKWLTSISMAPTKATV